MTTELPAPLVTAEVDLRDFAFMPLDVLRLRDSELSATPDAEAFRCAVLSWCVSWHQIPAASLPDDDSALARLLGFGRDLKGWKKVRSGDGLRGWVKCSDGRLYHPVVAEKANDAWRAKLAQRARTEAARKARDEARKKTSGKTSQPLSQTNEISVTDNVTGSKGQGQGQGEVNKDTSSTTRPHECAEPSSPPPRSFQIIQLLTRLEAARGKSLAPVVTTDRVLAAWVEAGVTDAQIEEAHGLAAAKRQKDDDAAPVNVRFLDVFVAKVVNPKEGGSGVTAKRQEWFMSWPEIEKKAAELGIEKREGEVPVYFRDRVYAAAGVTPEMIRKAEIDAGRRPSA